MALTDKNIRVNDYVTTRDGIGLLIRIDKNKTKGYLVKFGVDKVRPYKKSEVKKREV